VHSTSPQPLPNEALILDLLAWLDGRPQPYGEVMARWRTSCPRLTIWEDAVDARLVAIAGSEVRITAAGAALLASRR
jgi:hypothetical protein